jgi:hypothetical protein
MFANVSASSKQEEFHPKPLTEHFDRLSAPPYLKVSPHKACPVFVGGYSNLIYKNKLFLLQIGKL